MNKIKYLEKIMSRRQKEVYAQIVEEKKIKAKGPAIIICKTLQQLGLILPNPDSKEVNDYVLNGKPLNIPFAQKLPLPKDVVKKNGEASSIPIVNPVPLYKAIVLASPAKAPTVYSNISREQHVERWMNVPVKVNVKRFTPVKCLEEWQMEYIMNNYLRQTPKEMADHLGKEKYEVILFCQANAIEPATGRKIKDYYHSVPQKTKS